jgi:hypothetical protein
MIAAFVRGQHHGLRPDDHLDRGASMGRLSTGHQEPDAEHPHAAASIAQPAAEGDQAGEG